MYTVKPYPLKCFSSEVFIHIAVDLYYLCLIDMYINEFAKLATSPLLWHNSAE